MSDLPADIKEAAFAVVSELQMKHGPGGPWNAAGAIDCVARAILAERERCAKIADEFELASPGDEDVFVNKHQGRSWDSGFDAACTLIAQDIRRGGV